MTGNPPLRESEVHLWLLDARLPFSEAELDHCQDRLPPAERARAGRRIQAPRRREFILARALLLDTQHRYDDEHAGPLTFSVAATQALVACAVSRHPTGACVEWLGRRVHAMDVARRMLSPVASALLDQTLPVARRERFFDLWTVERAWAAASGTRAPRTTLPAGLHAGAVPGGTAQTTGAGGWCAFVLSPTSENRVAVVTQAPRARLLIRWTVPFGLTPGASAAVI